ncbi:heme A synthase [Parashewanella spongiae]|uniref:Heme A synthase n=1 Tax=Parashewanella spongiae TaxID=342950 RepID=A0A3A6U0V4_9GAMM|nr:COX15/CtaA family protein [Parashewanella spongiae]MCL1077865.1 COX15/CtaA family protein [Parashewanella spongiae]RJY17616.1 heme A synthase [Parashewanella spongiae]
MKLTHILKLTIVFAFIVILMGAYTRLADAGLGCPDWPGCYGHLKVPSQAHELEKVETHFPNAEIEPEKAWLEMIHRYLAGILGLMVLGILIYCLRKQNAPKFLPSFIAALIIFQALLGMWTVTMKLMPVVVMSHLLGGFSLISLLFILYLRIKPLNLYGGDAHARQYSGLALAALIVLVLQIILGGWTSSNYAAMACTTLPFCQGDWINNLKIANAFSPFQGEHLSFEYGVLDYATRMTIHVSHRIGAIITSILLVILAVKLLRSRTELIRNSAIIMLLLLVVQLTLGISNIVYHLPLPVAVAHNGGAALLLLSLVYINFAIWRKA